MPRSVPLKRIEFIRKLRGLGFDGPYAGSRHQLMVRQRHRLTIPSNAEFSVPQLRMMIRDIETILGRRVSPEEWDSL